MTQAGSLNRRSHVLRLVMVLTLVTAFAGAFTLQVHNAPSAKASGCVQTTWIDTGASDSAQGAHTSVIAYLQELVDKTDYTYCGSLRTRLHWQFDAPNFCASFGAAVDGPYGVGQYGVTYTSTICSGPNYGYGSPSGTLYSGAKAETCGTDDGWAVNGERAYGSGGCF